MMRKRIKRGGALLLASALVFAAMVMPEAQAAVAVDVNASCTLNFQVETTTFDELDDISIPVNIYKVADIDVSGNYTAVDVFDDESLDLSSVSEGNAAEWEARAAAASVLAEGTEPTTTATITGGEATVSNMNTGLYLVEAQDANSPYYTYSFSPYLISLPDNAYYKVDGATDDWIYNVTVGLKPEQTVRYGSLEIVKNLLVMNTIMGNDATFVFAVNVDEYPCDGTTDYTRYASVTYQELAAGAAETLVNNIPAGSTVTVSEVYTGSGYECLTGEQTQIIVADGEENAPVSVTFENTSDNTWNGGSGIENTFIADENGAFGDVDVTPSQKQN